MTPLVRCHFLVALSVAALTCSTGVAAGTWTCHAWTGDADSGIVPGGHYTVAVNCGGSAVTVNGVDFQADALAGPNFTIEGVVERYQPDGRCSVAGAGASLASDFIYGGSPGTVTLTNLTPAATYETSLFAYGFDAPPTTRSQIFAIGDARAALDQNLNGEGKGVRIACTFVADSSGSAVIEITPFGGGTFHLSALANRKVQDAPAAMMLTFGTNVAGSSAVIGRPERGQATITWTLPYGTTAEQLAKLVPAFTLSSGACRPAGPTVPQPNFGAGPTTYTVTDGTATNVYTVTTVVTPPSTACALETIDIGLPASRAVIRTTSGSTGSVVVSVPTGTTDAELAALRPVLTLSAGATCTPPTPPLRRSEPVHYVVTAQDGTTTRDYTVTTTDGGDFRLFIVKTATTGLTAADYDYLTLIPASKHANAGVPAILCIADDTALAEDVYLQDYLRRYRPAHIDTVNFTATVPGLATSAIEAASPLELSVALAEAHWKSSATVVVVSNAIDTDTYPHVLQAAALASALDAPLIYHHPAKTGLVRQAIERLGATEVIHVGPAGSNPTLATRTVAGPKEIVECLAGKKITVDYVAATNPRDTGLVSGAKLSLTAPFIAARRTGIVVPITSYEPVPNSAELFHYGGHPTIQAELQELYRTLGRHPEYLALVGNATSIPLAYRGPNEQSGQYYGAPADLDYANVDDDPFPDIAIGRVMAADVFDASLLTSRISTYEQLFDGVWEKAMVDVGGQWNAAYQHALAGNYGFGSSSLIGRLGPAQPVEAAIIAHNDHSSHHTLGGAFELASTNVLAPAFIGSHGCATAAIDFETIDESHDEATGWKNADQGAGKLIVTHLFKLGAVAFLGSTRSETGSGKMRLSAAVNALLAGEPLGRCYMAGVDTMTWNDFADERWNWILLGDPALRIHVPAAPTIAPASHVVTPVSDTVAELKVNIPATLFTPEVDPTWCSHWRLTYPQYWGEKPGIYGMDVDRFYLLRFTLPRPVAKFEQSDDWPPVTTWVWGDVKLGMMGPPAVDHRQDGTTQLVWAIRTHIMDWAGDKGREPLAAMKAGRFRITYEAAPPP
ncbi:MAG: C25 family cysteine peptidase [Planctomycetaceae bacterium]